MTFGHWRSLPLYEVVRHRTGVQRFALQLKYKRTQQTYSLYTVYIILHSKLLIMAAEQDKPLYFAAIVSSSFFFFFLAYYERSQIGCLPHDVALVQICNANLHV